MRMRCRAAGVWICAGALAIACAAARAADPCPAPAQLSFQVMGEIKRDALGGTQGLEQFGGILYESTGLIGGDTRLNTIAPDGRVKVLRNFGRTFFGEGLTILGDRIFQLSWQDHDVFVYDLKGTLVRRMQNPRDGWGLTNDGTSLIFTDGDDKLRFASPETFEITRSVDVRVRGSALRALNELEYVDGKVYANVFTTKAIVRVQPETGCVDGMADLSTLWTRMSKQERDHLASDQDFVLNGIAYDKGRGLFFLTGKNWQTIFTGRFVEAQ
jgi:glutamine cyclotransferase